MFVLCIFLAGYKGHEGKRNKVEKPKKWMQKLAAVNYTLAVVRNLRIKGQAEKLEPTRCSEKGFSLQRIYAVLTYWS